MLCASSLLTNIICAVIIVAILAGAITYIVVQKKKGNKCIGCPHGKTCAHTCSGAKPLKQDEGTAQIHKMDNDIDEKDEK